MEKGPSTFAEYWTSEYSEVNHFYKHGEEMGYENDINGYSQAAKNFANSNKNGIKSFKANNGSIYKYDPKTNEFGVISKEGKIVTYFNPSGGIDYFNNQYDMWGDYWINY